MRKYNVGIIINYIKRFEGRNQSSYHRNRVVLPYSVVTEIISDRGVQNNGFIALVLHKTDSIAQEPGSVHTIEN